MTGKISNKIAGSLIIMVLIAAVGLISYFAGLKQSLNLNENNGNLTETMDEQKKLTSDQLPKMPEISQASASSNNLPVMPK